MTNGEIRSWLALTSTWFGFGLRPSAFADSQDGLGRDAEGEDEQVAGQITLGSDAVERQD